MPPHRRRNSRELAEYISKKVLMEIDKKVKLYLRAKQDGNKDLMFRHQLTEEEYEFVQNQQRLDQDADSIDANSGYLNDMPENELDKMYERLAKDHDKALEIPPMPNLEEEEKNDKQ